MTTSRNRWSTHTARRLASLMAIGLVFGVVRSVHAQATLPSTAPGTQLANAPKGEVLRFNFDASQIFPGTTRQYWVYVPRQYDPGKPACLFVDQDAVQFNAPAVFDRLIAAGQMPVTIGVFIQPGRVKAPTTQSLDRFNRSYEFDGISDEYAKFLLDELLPDVETKTASASRAIKLSRNPDDRAIGGTSSGAICAFTTTWERNDSFHRVFSGIGTYVGLRGGNIYPTLIRKFEPKAIRIFLQDGSSDNNHYGGDWWMANQEMERALTFSGYEVNHFWGTDGHNSKDATKVFSDAMRWLWKDWPASVKLGMGSEKLQEILIPGESWTAVGKTFSRVDGPATNSTGEVIWCDVGAHKSCKVDVDGQLSISDSGMTNSGEAFGPDGKMYAVNGSGLHIYEADGSSKIIADGFHGNDLVVRSDGKVYVTESGGSGPAPASQVWLVTPSREKKIVDTGLKFPNGIALSPDQSLLYVDDYRSHWVYSYQIQPDGTLASKQRFYDLYVREADDDAGGDGMCVDRDGRLYVSTRAGIQVCDQAGRVNCIIPTPTGRVSALTFGGPEMDRLYALCGKCVFVRKLKVKGMRAFEQPIKPAPPKL